MPVLKLPNKVPVVMLPSGSAAMRINAFLRQWHRKHLGKSIAKGYYFKSTRGAVMMPPHVTFVSSGWLTKPAFAKADGVIKTFARTTKPFTITIDGFGIFERKVLFLRVRVNKTLLTNRKKLVKLLVNGKSFTNKHQIYHPHMTVLVDHRAGADLRPLLRALQKKRMKLTFKVRELALLCPQNASQWDVVKRYAFR